jgi:MerR family transcriptional regulator, thiopeptide resistance regulator
MYEERVYTVKQLSDLAGVTVRTLHYYDEIGLLRPSSVGENGYRYYGEDALLRLQQILLFREMDLGLLQIQQIIDDPRFDLVAALQQHREALQSRIERLQNLISTVDTTIMHIVGEVKMSNKDMFKPFTDEQQKQYEEEAVQLWGDRVKTSIKRWNDYTQEEKDRIFAEGGVIYADIVATMDKGPESDEVQQHIARWHQHLRYFYEPTPEILDGLGHAYNAHPGFIETFTKFHPDLPAFLEKAITHYCVCLIVNA